MKDKINIGSGSDILKDYINLDYCKQEGVDIIWNIDNTPWPFEDNTFSEAFCSHTLEHVNNLQSTMKEIWRISKPGAIIDVYVPHYSGMYALKHPTHYKFFGIGSFDIFRPEDCFNGERYSNARFNLAKEELLFFHHKLASMRWMTKLPINWILNFNRNWQLATEKFHLWAPDEIHYWLEVVK